MNTSAQPGGKKQPTLAEIKNWPATVDVPTAGAAFGIGRNHSYELVDSGEFPATVVRIGKRYRVVTESVVRVLSSQAQGYAQATEQS